MTKKKSAPVKKVTVPRAPKKQQTLIVGFDDETKELLRQLIAALSIPAKIHLADVGEIKPTYTGPREKVEVKHDAGKQETIKFPVKKTDETVTLTMIREMINAKVGEGKTDKVVKCLNKYGAKNASTLDEEHFAAFFEDLKDL